MFRSDSLLRLIVATAVGLAVFHAALVLYLGPGPVFGELPWYVPVIQSFAALASLNIAFLAFGRYRVLREPLSFWIGLAFITYAVLTPFYLLAFPGLLPDGRSFIALLPNTSVWLTVFNQSLSAIFLLAAAVVPWPRPGMPGERRWYWLVMGTAIVVAAIATFSVTFEQFLPIFVVDGVFTSLQDSWRFIAMIVYAAGALVSAYRYRQTGNMLFGYVSLTGVMFTFVRLVGFMVVRRYDFWWYWVQVLVVGAFTAMLFGLLSEYVGLYRRERENTRELAALLQVTDPTLARQGLEPLLHSLLERMVAIMGAKAGAILLLDPSRQELVLRCGEGIPAEQAVGLRVMVGENFSGRVAAQNAVFWVRDAEADPAVSSPYIKAQHVRGMVGAPMRIGEEVIGVVHVDFLVPREFSRYEERLLEVAAERAAQAIYQARLLEETRRRAAELAELDRLKDQFLTVAAHELKTPVTSVKGYAQYLLRSEHEGVSPLGLKALEAVNRQADRMSRLVNDLLEVTRIQTGRLEFRLVRLDLSNLVAEAVDRMKILLSRTEKHGLIFQSPGPVLVDVDPDRIEQVLDTLLDNAIKFSPEGGEVATAVSFTRRIDGQAVVSVRDHGVGIPNDKQARIFERFYRAHTGTPYDYGGMGVGLFIARETITRHGGRMWFESEEGQGSTFYFSLPLAT